MQETRGSLGKDKDVIECHMVFVLLYIIEVWNTRELQNISSHFPNDSFPGKSWAARRDKSRGIVGDP